MFSRGFLFSLFLVGLTFSQTINFQGVYNGTQVKSEVAVIVEFYDNGEESATPIWNEVHSSIAIKNGLFEMSLGSIESLGQVDFSKPLWFTVSVDGVKGAKKRLSQVPSSIHAVIADTSSSLKGRVEEGSTVAPNILVQSVNGLKDDISLEGDKGIVISQVEQKLVITLADSLSVTGVKGDKGDKGDQGDPGINGDFIDAVSFDSLGNIVFNTALNNNIVLEDAQNLLKGDKGEQGASITAAEFDDDGNILFRTNEGNAITLGNAVSTLTGPKGDKGEKGDQGDQGPAGTTPWSETDSSLVTSKRVDGNSLRISGWEGLDLPLCGPDNVGEMIMQNNNTEGVSGRYYDRILICFRYLYQNVNEGHYWIVIADVRNNDLERIYSTTRNGTPVDD